MLNHIAYSNCLPLIDGGVLVDSPEGRLVSAKWRVHLVGPDMRCLRCRGQYTSSEAADERQGLRRHGRYIDDPELDGPEPGQNTFAFCNLVASEEVRILLRYIVGESWWHDNDPTSGRWAFEHQFVDAHTTAFDHPVLVIPPVNSLESDWGTEDWGGRLIHFRQSLALVGVRKRSDWSGGSVVSVSGWLKLYLDDKSITDTIPVFQTWIGYEYPKSIHSEDHDDNI